MFLRQSTVGREPLAVAMSGVRMGERVLQIGVDTPEVTGLLAAKPGLSGESSMVVPDDATAVSGRRAAEKAGALNIRVHDLENLPYDAHSFDLVVVHNRNGQLATLSEAQRSQALTECRRVLRSGGRVVVIDKGTPSGLTAIFQSRKDPEAAAATVRALGAAGFRSVRPLGDRDGYSFVEGMNVEGSD